MRIDWLNKAGKDQVILFFNGWGMDERAVAHLKADYDVVMFYDYRSGEYTLPDLSNYHKIYLIAWSMGVWAASRFLNQTQIQPDLCIAINGTGKPVDDQYGIPEKIYELTERGMNENGREKFFLRMLDGVEEQKKFAFQKPQREILEQCEELMSVRRESTSEIDGINWNKLFISEKDMIFPVKNQLNWGQRQRIPIQFLAGGHYPFYQFRDWRDILEKNKRATIQE